MPDRADQPLSCKLNRRRLLAGTVLAAAFGASAARAEDGPIIAAAADLNYALKEVVAAFTRETGKTVKLTFGSSGNFAAQIQQGAPFELFLCADQEYVQQLDKQGKTDGAGVLYAIGRIGIFVPKDSPLRADGQLKDLATALSDGRLRKFAIANPEHAPYGRAARAALQHAGLWEKIEPKLVLGENASQAAQFATSGSTEGGIIPYSLARAPAIGSLGTFDLISESWHAPLRQRMVLLKGAGQPARAFYGYMQKPAARTILKRYGFVLPGEPL